MRRSGESMELSIKAGADVNTTDLFGRTPLMHAASTAFVECISLLLVFNAKINLRDKNGQNAIEVNIVELDGEISSERRHKNSRFDEDEIKKSGILLLAAGEKLQGTELRKYIPRGRVFPVEIPDYLQHAPELKLRLKHLCREAIRNHLITLDPHSYLFNRIPRLGLPSALNTYLLYSMSIEEDTSASN